jgi:hypothetical protein
MSIILEVIGILVVARYTEVAREQRDTMIEANRVNLMAAKAAKEAADAAKQANINAETTLHLTQGADIALEPVQCATPANPNNLTGLTPDTKIILHFSNSGRTRAKNVLMNWHFGLVGQPFKEISSKYPAIVPAGDRVPSVATETVGQVLGSQLDKVNLDPALFEIHGTVTYQDIWDLDHYLKFHLTYAGHCSFDIDKEQSQ